MTNIFKKSMAIILALALCLGVFVGTFTVAAEGEDEEQLLFASYEDLAASVLVEVTAIETGKEYVIVNKETGTVLTDIIEEGYHWYLTGSHVLLSGEPLLDSNKWSFVTYDDGYAIAHPDGGYLSPNTRNVHIAEEYSWITPVYVVYNETEAAFQIYRAIDGVNCYLQAATDANGDMTVAIGADQYASGEKYSYWTIYEVATYEGTTSDLNVNAGFLANEKLGFRFTASGDAAATAYDSYILAFNRETYNHIEDAYYAISNEWELFELTAGESVDWTGIAAYEMTSALKFAFFGVDSEGNTEYIATAETTFADMVANTAATAEDKTVYADLLNYGIATQAYFASKYPDSDLADASVFENAYSDYATNAEDATIDLGDTDYTRYVDETTGATIYASLQIQSSNRIVFAVDSGTADVDTLTLEVYDGETLIASKAFSELELAGGKYHYFPSEDEAIALYDTNKVLTAKVTDGTNVIVTRNYSVAAFVKNVMLADESLAALGTAVAQITCSLNSDEGAEDTDQPYLQKVTPDNIITEGSAEYIFVNNKTGWVLGTTATTNSLGGDVISVDTTSVTVNSPAWTVTFYSANRYFLSTDTITSMAPNSTNVNLKATSAPCMYYTAEKDGWVIYRNDSKYCLQTGTYWGSEKFAYGYWPNGVEQVSEPELAEGAYWTIYQVVGEVTDDTVDPEEPVDPDEDEDGIEGLTLVTAIESGKNYVIVNAIKNTVMTKTPSGNSLLMGEAPSASSDAWTITLADNGKYVLPITIEGTTSYAQANANNITFPTELAGKIVFDYDETTGYWAISRQQDGSSSIYYFTLNEALTAATGSAKNTRDDNAYWLIYEVDATEGGDDTGNDDSNDGEDTGSDEEEVVETVVTLTEVTGTDADSKITEGYNDATYETFVFVNKATGAVLAHDGTLVSTEDMTDENYAWNARISNKVYYYVWYYTDSTTINGITLNDGSLTIGNSRARIYINYDATSAAWKVYDDAGNYMQAKADGTLTVAADSGDTYSQWTLYKRTETTVTE